MLASRAAVFIAAWQQHQLLRDASVIGRRSVEEKVEQNGNAKAK